MKQLFLLGMMVFTLTNSGFAKIWRVNNNVGVTADFTSAQQAHDAALVLAGDTLYFEHSAASYGNLIMIKGLNLMGVGAFLLENPGIQYNNNSSYLGDITLRPTATNSLISVNCNTVIDSANNLKILRCRTSQIFFRGASNCVVANSYIMGISFSVYFTGSPSCLTYGCVGMSIYNNICKGNIMQEALAYIPNQYGGCGFSWVMPHSVVAFNNSISGLIRITGFAYNNLCGYILTDGSTAVNNNIFYDAQTSSNRTVYFSGTEQTNSTLESGNGNQFSINISSVYSSTSPISSLADTAWKLNPTSVAIGAGSAGVDCGATGGGAPYVFGAQPAIPTIYKLNVAPAPTGNTIGVTISTRSNN